MLPLDRDGLGLKIGSWTLPRSTTISQTKKKKKPTSCQRKHFVFLQALFILSQSWVKFTGTSLTTKCSGWIGLNRSLHFVVILDLYNFPQISYSILFDSVVSIFGGLAHFAASSSKHFSFSRIVCTSFELLCSLLHSHSVSEYVFQLKRGRRLARVECNWPDRHNSGPVMQSSPLLCGLGQEIALAGIQTHQENANPCLLQASLLWSSSGVIMCNH